MIQILRRFFHPLWLSSEGESPAYPHRSPLAALRQDCARVWHESNPRAHG